MRCLIDTHILIWAAYDPGQLPAQLVDIIRNPENDIYVSVASLWEMAIKKSLGKLQVDDALFSETEAHGYQSLPIEPRHIHTLLALPHHHRDPFDRMLIAQAITENLTILSHDEWFAAYDVKLVGAIRH